MEKKYRERIQDDESSVSKDFGDSEKGAASPLPSIAESFKRWISVVRLRGSKKETKRAEGVRWLSARADS
jgi:hypothetical protein